MDSPTPMDMTGARVLGSLVNSQSELIWGTAIALIGVELYVLLKLYGMENWNPRIRCSWGVLFVAILLHLASLLFGYFAMGSVTTMAKKAAAGEAAWKYYENAIGDSAYQFLLFACGFALFIVISIVNLKTLANIFNGTEDKPQAPAPDPASVDAAAASATAAAGSAQTAAQSAKAATQNAKTALEHANAAKEARNTAEAAMPQPPRGSVQGD